MCVRCIAGASGDAVATGGEKPEPPTSTRPDDLKGDWLWVSALELWLLKYEDQIFASYHDLPQVGGVSECRARARRKVRGKSNWTVSSTGQLEVIVLAKDAEIRSEFRVVSRTFDKRFDKRVGKRVDKRHGSWRPRPQFAEVELDSQINWRIRGHRVGQGRRDSIRVSGSFADVRQEV